jgi:predicted ATPase/DNA-binding NarL/FixJ family response regulator
VKAHALPPNNLPVQLTSFVGREPEMAELADLLRQARLVTIAGAAGLGKTRLAAEVAGRLRAEHPEGSWFVSLAALVDPEVVAREVGTALGVREQFGESPVDLLAGHVGSRRVLLVLDNCEHLLDACARLAEALLLGCPALRVLATSHEPLRVPGERVWRIGPLDVPAARDTGMEAFGELARAEAVRLFQARAALVQPQFTVSPGNVVAVASVCRRLDGIPLAIELAAARTEMMSIDDILGRLEDRFRLLTGGSRTVMPRHQTLRAALDWGHHLLNEQERKLFRRLSVFPGSFELAAAEAICAGPDTPPPDVMCRLSRLVEKSLLVPEAGPGGQTRYRMLETIRQYAAERLLEAAEGDGLRRCHADHFLALAEHAAAFDRRPGQADWLARLEADHDDLRAALQWSRAHDRGRWVRLALALPWFWLVHGHLSEARDGLQGVLTVPSLTPLERARALFWLSRTALWQGECELAGRLGEESLVVSRELGDEELAGWTLSVLGSVYTYLGDDERGQACLEEMLALARDSEQRVDALVSLGELLLLRGDLAGARRYLEEGQAAATEPDSRWILATGALFLAIVDYYERDYRAARRRVRDALEVFRLVGNHYALAGALQMAAALALAAGDPSRALRLAAAGEALREAIRAPLARRWQAVVRSLVVEPAQAALSPELAEVAWAEGLRLGVDEAVAYALSDPSASGPDSTGSANGGPDMVSLSRREREVALLITRGLTNRQVARQLVIAERTVEGHLERIRGKLDVHSRTQIAVWVVERGWLNGPGAEAG